MTKTVLIQVPITFIDNNPNVGIEFEDIPENYGKKIKLTLSENKSLRSNPKSWDYYHILQETNLVEFTSVDYGNYHVTVQCIDEESIQNPFKIKTVNKQFNIGSIINTDEQKVSVPVVNSNNGLGNVTARRGGFMMTQGSFTLSGGGSTGGGK